MCKYAHVKGCHTYYLKTFNYLNVKINSEKKNNDIKSSISTIALEWILKSEKCDRRMEKGNYDIKMDCIREKQRDARVS